MVKSDICKVAPPDLLSMIERAITNGRDHFQRRPEIHVTDLAVGLSGGDQKCPRQLWLRLHNAEEVPPHRGQILMWEFAHGIHEKAVEWICSQLPAGFDIVAIEKPLKGERLGVKGRPDMVLRSPALETIVVDFKSQRGKSFGYLDMAKPAHELQVQSYMYDLDADYGILLYIDREGQNYGRQFLVERNDARVLAAKRVAERIAASEKAPPVMDPVLKRGKPALPWQCEWCSYYNASCTGADVTGIDRALKQVATSG